MADIHKIRGNLFDSGCDTIVNTVNCVGVMGKGVALEFRYRYPNMYEQYVRDCENGRLEPGTLTFWHESKPRVLNFPTKKHWKDPSRLSYIEAGLKAFATKYREWGIGSIAFPKLGTSSGGLDWEDVRPIMVQYLKPLADLRVEIYSFDANASDTLFEQLKERLKDHEEDFLIERLGLKPSIARTVYRAIRSEEVSNMHSLQRVKGVGEKSLSTLYTFVRSPTGTSLSDYQ